MRKKILFMFLFATSFFILKSTSNTYAYIPEDNFKIYNVQFDENKKVVNTGSRLHIKLQVEGVNKEKADKCIVSFMSKPYSYTIDVNCKYNPSTDTYEGVSDALSKTENAELEYESHMIGFYEKHPNDFEKVTFDYSYTFVYSDDCYNGKHTGGYATCTHPGHCSLCGAEYEDQLPHVAGDWEVAMEPSCKREGRKELKCKNCGTVLKTEQIKKLQHNFTEWKVIKEPDASNPGTKMRYCLRCYTRETKEIPKIKVTLNDKTVTLKRNQTYTLKIKSYTRGDKIKKWTTSNKKIATVDSHGKVKAKKKGKASVTLTMKSGAKASCKIIVK